MVVSMENRYFSAKTSGVKCGNWTKDRMTTMDTTLTLDMSHAQNSETPSGTGWIWGCETYWNEMYGFHWTTRLKPPVHSTETGFETISLDSPKGYAILI
ncbi:uncharacterized protein SEPMUDRAFT_116868 [Sphaerulina musiva SO2202]|uniref:Uncharacterized protein n=1 Tax=Sphaerulina musiva (strain SO2202) TaxID=692275 RepID=M3D7K3_SPHMS|nr:uncharacterized protein SEPMUDRAFT_116868 [Sphaerulina musiva SO2202]EMF13859.1 hypothetical protein SEPMUDRAFT_116868 [Sphaerulina musiva SO2202]